MRLRDESARFVHGVTIVFDGRNVDIRVCEQKIEIDAVGEHLFAGAVVVLKAEQNIEILILCPVLYAQVGVPVGADLILPRQGFVNGGAALQSVLPSVPPWALRWVPLSAWPSVPGSGSIRARQW